MTDIGPVGERIPTHDQPLREAVACGEFVLQRCPECHHIPNYPRVACPQCFTALRWVPAEGRGTVTTYAIVRRPHHERFNPYIPIVLALVALTDGGEVITTIVGDNRLDTEIGVQVVHVPKPGWANLPQFQLIS